MQWQCPPPHLFHCSSTFNDHRHLSHIVDPSFRPSSHIAAGINVVMLDVGGAQLLPLQRWREGEDEKRQRGAKEGKTGGEGYGLF